jgi:hypothetical protein
MSKGSTNRTRNRKAFHANHPERHPGRPGKTIYVVRDGRVIEKPEAERRLPMLFEMCWGGANPPIGNEWQKIARVPLHPRRDFSRSWVGDDVGPQLPPVKWPESFSEVSR